MQNIAVFADCSCELKQYERKNLYFTIVMSVVFSSLTRKHKCMRYAEAAEVSSTYVCKVALPNWVGDIAPAKARVESVFIDSA